MSELADLKNQPAPVMNKVKTLWMHSRHVDRSCRELEEDGAGSQALRAQTPAFERKCFEAALQRAGRTACPRSSSPSLLLQRLSRRRWPALAGLENPANQLAWLLRADFKAVLEESLVDHKFWQLARAAAPKSCRLGLASSAAWPASGGDKRVFAGFGSAVPSCNLCGDRDS